MNDCYKEVVPKVEEEEVTSAFNPQPAPKQELVDLRTSSTREADNDKKHEEHVAGFRDISNRDPKQISYKDYAEEEMNKDEVIQRLAYDYPEQLHPYFNNLPASSTIHCPRWIKKKLPSEMKANVASASNALIPAPKIRHPKRPQKAKQPSTYIPLTVRENKKDDYYWY